MPDWEGEVRRRLAGLRLRPTREAEIVEELSQHLEDRYEQALRGGAGREEAYRAALQELTESDLLAQGLSRVERPVRLEPVAPGTPRRFGMLGDLKHDLRYGARMLWKNKGFTAVAVVALALGIGANSAIFSVVNTVLLRPLPYREPERLVMVWEENAKHGFPKNTPAAANYADWRDQNQVFEGMSAMADQSFNLTGVGEPERIEGRRVSASLFPLLGVEPRSEEHTSELQSRQYLVCRLLLEKKKSLHSQLDVLPDSSQEAHLSRAESPLLDSRLGALGAMLRLLDGIHLCPNPSSPIVSRVVF